MLSSLLSALATVALASATSVLWDGRAPFSLTNSDLNSNTGPFLTVVKGSEDATHYSSLLGHSQSPTPLWNKDLILTNEQAISISIDNSSVFVPGGGAAQYGFRRTEFIAANNGVHDAALFNKLETGTTVFHFSVKQDPSHPLNYNHEYQVVFIEPNDGTHVFELQIGSPFTNPTGKLPVKDAHFLKIRDHALNLLFETPFVGSVWHNFAVKVDWTNRTLEVLYSLDALPLEVVKKTSPNLSATAGVNGQGDFHFGIVKLPLVNPKDTPANQGDVVHYGIQEGTKEALLYSGVFVEDGSHGVSVGYGLVSPFA